MGCDIGVAITHLMSAENAYARGARAARFGLRDLPALSRLLFDPTEHVQLRRRAARALGELGAADALVDYLVTHADSVALDDDLAVVEAAAQAVRRRRDPRAFAPLLKLALEWRLKGAIEALANFDWPQAVPGLVAGLYTDESRAVAEAALLRIGRRAAPILLETVGRAPSYSAVTGARLRARRAAARILSRTDLSGRQSREFGRLIPDPDPDVSACACLAVVEDGVAGSSERARTRLAELLPRLQLPLRKQAEAILANPKGRTETPSVHSPDGDARGAGT